MFDVDAYEMINEDRTGIEDQDRYEVMAGAFVPGQYPHNNYSKKQV